MMGDRPLACQTDQRSVPQRRAALFGRLWLVGTWLAARRRAKVRPEDVQHHLYRQQTRGLGLRWTEWLRDRLRPRWLRVRRDEDEGGE